MRSDSSYFHLRFDLGLLPLYYGIISFVSPTFLSGGMQPRVRFDVIELMLPMISPPAFLNGTLNGWVNFWYNKYGALLARIFCRLLQSVGVKTRSATTRADSGSVWSLTSRQRIGFFLYLLDVGLSPLERKVAGRWLKGLSNEWHHHFPWVLSRLHMNFLDTLGFLNTPISILNRSLISRQHHYALRNSSIHLHRGLLLLSQLFIFTDGFEPF